MSGWTWLWLTIGACVVAVQIVRLLGPFDLAGEHGPDARFTRRARTFFTGWLRRPRDPLTFSDWMPHAGDMFLPWFTTVCLLIFGAGVVAGPKETFRIGGVLAVLAGTLLAFVIGGYVMRPVGEPTLPRVGSRFSTERGGYRPDEVDEAFERIAAMTKADIRSIRFRTVRLGYCKLEVDRALDEAAESRPL